MAPWRRAGNFIATLFAMMPLLLGEAARGGELCLRQGWNVTAFLGQHDNARFVEILTFRGGRLDESYMAGLAINRQFGVSFDGDMRWEAEAALFRHWGRQHHWEGTAALIMRWARFPWDEHLPTSVAIGHGVSIASQRPPVEGQTREALYHLLAEAEITPIAETPFSLVGRIHHRSGVFGLWGKHGGSNFLTLGLRYRF